MTAEPRLKAPRWWAWAWVMLLLGCGHVGPVRWQAQPTEAASYSQRLSEWTRHGATYEALEGRLFVDATLIAPAFALAQAREEAQRLGLTTTERNQLEQARVKLAQETLAVHLSMVTGHPGWNNLDHSLPTFRVRMITGETATAPLKIHRLSFEERDRQGAYFPYVVPMAEQYWIEFPKPEQVGVVLIRIAGAHGRADLRWEVQ